MYIYSTDKGTYLQYVGVYLNLLRSDVNQAPPGETGGTHLSIFCATSTLHGRRTRIQMNESISRCGECIFVYGCELVFILSAYNHPFRSACNVPSRKSCFSLAMLVLALREQIMCLRLSAAEHCFYFRLIEICWCIHNTCQKSRFALYYHRHSITPTITQFN